MKHVKRIGLGVLLVSVLIGVIYGIRASQAANLVGLEFRITCSGISSEGGAIDLDRDNTGNNREAYTFIAKDGYGNLILGPMTEQFVVGGRQFYAEGTFFVWDIPPQANPITLMILSAGGNGFNEQLLYTRVEDCPQLTARGQAQVPFELLDADGGVSPSIPLNQPLPNPVNVNNVANLLGLPGFAVVNTARLNIRSGDGVQYTRVGILDGGTELIVLGRNPEGSWWYVQVADIRGWVSGEYIALRGDLQNTPWLPGEGEIQPPRFIYYAAAPLYRGPDPATGEVCVVAGNLEFNVYGRTPNWEWYQVRATCNGAEATGWVKNDLGALRNPAEANIPITG
jgi:hypothetical protein